MYLIKNLKNIQMDDNITIVSKLIGKTLDNDIKWNMVDFKKNPGVNLYSTIINITNNKKLRIFLENDTIYEINSYLKIYFKIVQPSSLVLVKRIDFNESQNLKFLLKLLDDRISK